MKGFVFVVLLLFCSGCATLSVNTDYNPSYDFSRLRTYAWLDDGTPPATDTRINNDLVIGRVRAAVEWTLDSKGFVKTDPAQADFRVTWFGAIDKKLQGESIEHFYSPYGYGALYRGPYWSGPAIRTTTIREYEVGTLIIDILDPVQHRLIWRGSGSDRLSSYSDPKKITKETYEAVRAILKEFPPLR